LYTLVIAERAAHEVRTIKAGRAHHENRSNAIVDILVVAGVRETTRLASIENVKSLVYAQVSGSFLKSIVGWRGSAASLSPAKAS
jgi:hypothetical protein